MPELLSPAGDWDCARAAIENGADAVYFGLECGFNARARAANFPLADLPRLMEMLHLRGLKGYATLNTLVFSDELSDFAQVIEAVAAAGVDAVLVQDVGAAQFVRRICPDLPLHASTQMTMTSAETIALAEKLGCERVVLARELSIDEIVSIRRQTAMPLEVFVHGALCVAYSGQCLTSESLGGRSANRGQCAQACRLPYDLVCDGKDVDLGNQKYLLSPQDLAAYALAPELLAAGVASFKIEGRLKTPEYVANITQHYRRAIDAAVAVQPAVFSPRDVEEMELSFSRGFSPGWLQGCDHKMLVPATTSAKRGVRLGRIEAVGRGRVTVELAASVKRGDGVAFDCGATSDDALGGRVYEVFQAGLSLTEPVATGRVELTFAREAFDFGRLAPGQIVWKTDDPELTARLRKTFSGSELRRRQPVDLVVTAAVGKPLVVRATLASGTTCDVESEESAVEAKKHPLTEATLREQLGRLGGTPFELRGLSAEIEGRPMLPLSVLGKLRHALAERMSEVARSGVGQALACHSYRQAEACPTTDRQAKACPPTDRQAEACPTYLVRSLDQLRALLALVSATDPAWLEVVIHQRMPMFHMEHCVFCAVLSPGTNKTNCGRPCDDHVVKLRDRIGVEHPLTADVGCRNTLFNAVPQSAAEAVPALLARGVRRFRVEFLDEPADEIGRVVRAYRDLLAGMLTGREVWTLLKAANRVGVTRGTLEERRNPLAIL